MTRGLIKKAAAASYKCIESFAEIMAVVTMNKKGDIGAPPELQFTQGLG